MKINPYLIKEYSNLLGNAASLHFLLLVLWPVAHSILNEVYVPKYLPILGVQVRNMKMVFNIYGTWRRVTFEKLMMKNYDFF